MIYSGPERRKVQDHTFIICKQEDSIKLISDSVIKIDGKLEKIDLRINGTLEKMAVHVEDSVYWRRFIVGVAISLVIAIIGGITTASTIAYNLGQYTRQIIINTGRLEKLEMKK